MRRRRWIAVVLLLTASCYRPTYGECTVRCSSSVGCPGSLRCVGGVCTSGPACPTEKTDASAPQDMASEPSPDRHGGDAAAETAADTAGPASCLPPGTPGGVLWLDASRGVVSGPDGRVSLWTDQSGAENHARQTLEASRPTYSGGTPRRLPAVSFDGNLAFLNVDDAPSLRWG